jgi:hypothetical protein
MNLVYPPKRSRRVSAQLPSKLTKWLTQSPAGFEGKVCIDVTRERAAYVLRESLPMREVEGGTKSYSPSPDTSAQVKASDY